MMLMTVWDIRRKTGDDLEVHPSCSMPPFEVPSTGAGTEWPKQVMWWSLLFSQWWLQNLGHLLAIGVGPGMHLCPHSTFEAPEVCWWVRQVSSVLKKRDLSGRGSQLREGDRVPGKGAGAQVTPALKSSLLLDSSHLGQRLSNSGS